MNEKSKPQKPPLPEAYREHLEKAAEGYAQLLSSGHKIGIADIIQDI